MKRQSPKRCRQSLNGPPERDVLNRLSRRYKAKPGGVEEPPGCKHKSELRWEVSGDGW